MIGQSWNRSWKCGDYSCPLCYKQPGGSDSRAPVGTSAPFVPPARVAMRMPPVAFSTPVPPPPRAAGVRPRKVMVKDLNRSGMPSGRQEEKVVLSYFHTVSAAVQILNIAEESVKKFGESSSDLQKKITSEYGYQKWKQVQDKSLANEKSHNVQERQKEAQKQQAKISRATEKLLASKCGPKMKYEPKAVGKQAAASKVTGKSTTGLVVAGKPTAVPKATSMPTTEASSNAPMAPKAPSKQPKVAKTANKPSIALKNAFAALEDSDSDDE